MANLTATQISELNSMCAGAYRASLGTELADLQTRMDNIQAGLFDYRGAYDASVNTFPAAGGSGTAGAILKGDVWVASVAGTLGGDAVQVGDFIFANVDAPGQTASKWDIIQGNIKSTADVPDSPDARYVTDADLVVIGNTSGTNTGDQVVTKLYSLGTPIAADDDRIVVIGNGTMKVGDYTLSAQPDVPRNVTVTHTSTGTTDTLGTITVTGTDVNDEVISEEITPVADSAVSGLKAFKTITAVTGAGWDIDGVEATADTVTVGVGDALGLPVVIALATSILMGFVGLAPIVPVVLANAAISNCTANLTTGTYDGTKVVLVFITQ